ncbi:carboxypeptidase-like regulatory domain-containing protein [Croceiramulus getboli]|nr:carboxypeptidase-like regulatory domain-containing protein [Flavobacteriaceae bacterium YJPT1-3]
MRKTFDIKNPMRAFSVLATFLIVFCAIPGYAQEEENTDYNQYQGEVVDSDNNDPLVFATLYVDGTNISTVTNSEGAFLLKTPKEMNEGDVTISFLGYQSKTIALADLKAKRNRIELKETAVELPTVSFEVPSDAEKLVRATLKKKGENYFDNPTKMTAFYRETIKKRRRNVSLSEAVVNIYKEPYDSNKRDQVQLYKSRKSTDYDRLDTIALKLQGGPFNTLFLDIMKYPEYIFTDEDINLYDFKLARRTVVNDQSVYIIDFKQKEDIAESLYEGKLYIDPVNKILVSAIYSLNIKDKNQAASYFVKRKPNKADVWPTEVSYRVDYREKDGKWYYGYSNALLEFKIDWDDRLFNSVYSMTCEMAVTDWKKNSEKNALKNRDRLKSSIILVDEASGFSDPDFWGEYNIIEPDKSIESAIKKIQRQLRRAGNGAAAAQ